MAPDFLASVLSSHDTEWDKNEVLGCLDPGDVPSWLTVAWVGASLLQTQTHQHIQHKYLTYTFHFRYKAISYWKTALFTLLCFQSEKWDSSAKLVICEVPTLLCGSSDLSKYSSEQPWNTCNFKMNSITIHVCNKCLQLYIYSLAWGASVQQDCFH